MADQDKLKEKWWLALPFGLAMLAGAVWVYQDLTKFEVEGGTRRINWIAALAYNYLGKWGVVGLLALIGVGAIIHGIVLFVNRGKADEDSAPAKPRKKPELED